MRAIVLIAGISVLGCSALYPQATRPVEPAIARALKEPKIFSELPVGEQSATIGDDLFVLRRFATGAREVVAVRAPAGLLSFPESGTWLQTHLFTTDEGSDLAVFTCPLYYGGDVGVILDSKGRLATHAAIVQVRGPKRGRRWESAERGKEFFSVPVELIETWGLRYGGHRGINYVFDIFERSNPTVTTITQSILVSDRDFSSGFVVRGVSIRGLSGVSGGAIRFVLDDTRNDR